MRNVPIPDDRRRDPLAWTLHPNVSRDPERTPMQWEPSPGAGFTTGEPWLPLAADADRRNVAVQQEDPAALLHLYRELLALRRGTPALRAGRFDLLDAPDDVLAFERCAGSSRAVVALNFGETPARAALGGGQVRDGLHTRYGAALPEVANALELGPAEGVVLVLD